jgi:methylsterol monooxygenase
LKHVFLHKLTSEIPLTLGSYPFFVWLGVESKAPLPSLWTIVWTLALSFVIEDAWHYFAHRSLHAKWAYAKIHHIHHKYTTPFGIAANYAHPLETFYTGFGTILAVLVIRPHLATMLIWIVARQWQAVSVHVGFDFPWRLSRVLPILGGARFHDRHHERFTCNYAPTFVWWDRILKTADEENLGVKPRAVATEPGDG